MAQKTPAPPTSSNQKLMILDCDTGVDDAHAILMAVADPNTHLLAITCVQGNVGVDQVCYNVARTLEACRKDGVGILGTKDLFLGFLFKSLKHRPFLKNHPIFMVLL